LQLVPLHLGLQDYGSLWVVQKYIEAPVLVHGRKFDIRQFAMVTPDGSVYMYSDSYVRTCSAEYDVNNLDVKAIHLTNDAVQKVLDSYGVGGLYKLNSVGPHGLKALALSSVGFDPLMQKRYQLRP
jgi:hypothetical protein